MTLTLNLHVLYGKKSEPCKAYKVSYKGAEKKNLHDLTRLIW